MDAEAVTAFSSFSEALVGQVVSHIWRGAGSAIFIEFGKLRPGTPRRDGSIGNPLGVAGLMIEWSWRLEESLTILCGSWSNEDSWSPTFNLLKGQAVIGAQLFGRLPEIEVAFSNGMFLLSFMTSDGDPQWALFDRRHHPDWRSISVRDGELNVEARVRHAW